MGEIKSSWEIAMEKVDKLKELTPDELKKQEEERYTLVGQAIADKYIEAINLRQLKFDLDKYNNEERKLLRPIIASSLISNIELGDYDGLDKIIEAASYIRQKEISMGLIDEIKKLFQEYEKAKEKVMDDMDGLAMQALLNMGISGSAIAEVNTKASGEYEQLSNQLDQPFIDRLELFKKSIQQP